MNPCSVFQPILSIWYCCHPYHFIYSCVYWDGQLDERMVHLATSLPMPKLQLCCYNVIHVCDFKCVGNCIIILRWKSYVVLCEWLNVPFDSWCTMPLTSMWSLKGRVDLNTSHLRSSLIIHSNWKCTIDKIKLLTVNLCWYDPPYTFLFVALLGVILFHKRPYLTSSPHLVWWHHLY